MSVKPDIRACRTRKAWRELEKYYTKATRKIRIPSDLSPRDILRINSEIDYVYGLARYDSAYARNMYDRYKERFTLAKKQAMLAFKDIPRSGPKLTAEDREALVLTHLETKVMPGMADPLIVGVEKWRERKLFMEAVLESLDLKSGMMINGNGALKLDAQGRGDWPGKRTRDDD